VRETLGLFEGYGVELEYVIVDRETLAVRPLADRLLASVAGSIVSEVARGTLAWSNELALHVIELKTNGPAGSLHGLADAFQADVRRANAQLAAMNACLLPTGMHPWMDPTRETRLWPHEQNVVYEAFDRIFSCRGHGWANLQSTHLNLAFAGDREFGRLHAAVRLVLPILPALAASSPILDSRVTGVLDNRLEVYARNCARIPSITGRVIPERVFTRRDYEDGLLGRLYRDIAPHDPEGVLRHEWLNARGAIARFERSALEIRVLDIQECPAADVAVLEVIVRVLQALAGERWQSVVAQQRWEVEPLAEIFLTAVRDAEAAVIANPDYLAAFGLRDGKATAGELWTHLAEACFAPGEMVPDALDVILREGPLARRILRATGPSPDRATLEGTYRGLTACLAEGRMFHPDA
jgi:gamma-glutamyl:cysteine ligase YbdK (ATP-grasp superfamily)